MNQDTIFMVGQIVGVLAFLVSASSNFNKNKEHIMRTSIIAYLFYVTHYFMIGALAGSYTLILGMTRDLYIYEREKHHKKHRSRKLYNNFVVFLLLAAIYVGLITMNIINMQWFNILPLAAGLVYLFFEWFSKSKRMLKIGGGLTTLPWLFYDAYSGSIPAFCSDTFSLIIRGIGLSRDKKKRQNANRKK